MPKELTVGVEFHDFFGDFARGSTEILGKFSDAYLPLISKPDRSYVQTVAFTGPDSKLHVCVLPSVEFLSLISLAIERIASLDGTSVAAKAA